MITLVTALTFAAGIFVIWLVCKLLAWPLRILWKLLINAVIGAAILLLVNLVGGVVGFAVAITPISALVAGIFGIPGVIVLIILALLF